MVELDSWFQSWVLESVYSAGGGRSSVVLSRAVDSDINLSVTVRFFERSGVACVVSPFLFRISCLCKVAFLVCCWAC